MTVTPLSRQAVRVLFLCTENASRSQLAEGLARALGGAEIDAVSAGSDPTRVHPLAIAVMRDVEIDISAQRSKPLGPLLQERFDFVITVCDRIREHCPVWPDAQEHIHWSVGDPSSASIPEEDRVHAFRRVRDELRQRIVLFLLANRINTSPALRRVKP